MKRKIIVVVLTLYMCLIPVQSISLKIPSLSSNAKLTDLEDNYLIKDVPYVGQETGRDCELCSFTMLVQYLKKNYCLHDIIYLVGGGHALSYNPPWDRQKIIAKLHPPTVWVGSFACICEDDWTYISPFLGVKCNITYRNDTIDESMEESAWNEYWQRVKAYIICDMPVYAQINMSCLTRYKEDENFPNHVAMCHAIVIVGFNESNGTVCIHDPEPGFFDEDEEGTYVYENISTLHDAVRTATESSFPIYKNGYCTITLENISKPWEKPEAFEEVRVRNHKKMEGCSSAYDDIYFGWNKEFGINALKAFKKDMTLIKIIPKIPIWKVMNIGSSIFFSNPLYPFEVMPEFLKTIQQEKQFSAQVLLEQSDCKFCQEEGFLLQNESQRWGELHNLYFEFVESFDNNHLGKTMIYSIPLFFRMNEVIDEIISIEKIILNPSL